MKIYKEVSHYENGNVRTIIYRLNGKMHHDTEPALQIYDEDGSLIKISYFIYGKCHKENGPAEIYYYRNGNIRQENYIINNRFHREDGRAIVMYFQNGKVNYRDSRFYLNNEKQDFRHLKHFKNYVKTLILN